MALRCWRVITPQCRRGDALALRCAGLLPRIFWQTLTPLLAVLTNRALRTTHFPSSQLSPSHASIAQHRGSSAPSTLHLRPIIDCPTTKQNCSSTRGISTPLDDLTRRNNVWQPHHTASYRCVPHIRSRVSESATHPRSHRNPIHSPIWTSNR